MLKKLAIFLLFSTIILINNLFALEQKTIFYIKPATPNIKIPYDRTTITDLDEVKQNIVNNEYTLAIIKLVQVLEKLKINQREDMIAFFPLFFNDYIVENNENPIEGNYNMESVGVLFSQHYRNENGNSIDVNILFLDPSITEYLNIINNPELIDNLDNTSIIKIKDKFALEKFSQEGNFNERNIIINKDAILNVIVNGLEAKEIMNSFCKKIDLKKLDEYLQR